MIFTSILGLLVSILQYVLLFKAGELLRENKSLLVYLGIIKSSNNAADENNEIEKPQQAFDVEKALAFIGTLIQYLALAGIAYEIILTIVVMYRIN